MTFVITALLIFHGALHLPGFIKAFQPTRFRALNLSVSRYNGILWLSAAMLFVTAGILFALQFGWWWMFCFLGTNISQYLIIKYWSAAKFGTIANVIILVFSAFGFIIWVNLG
jgi:hypothetical protein